MPDFHVVPGTAVSQILTDSRAAILDRVRAAYLAHDKGLTINPDSYFLRFPEKPNARVIALPAYVGGEVDTIGIKWIASFPDNVDHGIPRASAVLLLNDYATGYPFACLEAGGISAARTAASAACAVSVLAVSPAPVSVAFVGAGVIARTICDYLCEVGIVVTDVVVHDPDHASADHLVAHVSGVLGVPTSRCESLQEAMSRDVVVFATTAAAPYVPADTALRPGQLLLNISLRDLAPELLLASNNVLDDVEHCLKAQTSPHLAEQLSGSRRFVDGTLADALRGDLTLDPRRATIFSPFGLGILDVAVGAYVLETALKRGTALDVPGFFGEPTRW